MAITKDTQIGAKFEENVVAQIDNYAAQHEMDRSKVLRLAVKQFLGIKPAYKTESKRKAV
ncbi:MAG: hypothetical protein O9264_08850 [Leptospira sp.]|nr:hypothetical protein [Leptospira sp.]